MASIQKKKATRSFILALLLLLVQLQVFSQTDRTAKINNLYKCLLEYKIECPKTVLAIIVFETGWLECKNCSYQYNNLFGFRTNQEYIRFKSVYACLDYFKIWEQTYYDTWKIKHPKGTYYEYLTHVKYAHVNIAHYIRTIKSIEKLVAENTSVIDASLRQEPGFLQDVPQDTIPRKK